MITTSTNLPPTTKVKNHQIKLGDLIPYYFQNSLLGLVIKKKPVTILLDTMEIMVVDLKTINVFQLK